MHPPSDSPTADNSYLQETTYNSDIDENIRQEIERKYRRSVTNSRYTFPRTGGPPAHQRTRSGALPKLQKSYASQSGSFYGSLFKDSRRFEPYFRCLEPRLGRARHFARQGAKFARNARSRASPYLSRRTSPQRPRKARGS